MTNPTFSTSSLAPIAEAVKGTGVHELRLFGGGGTEHYTQFRLPVPPFEVALAATLHYLHVAATSFSALSRTAPFERNSRSHPLTVGRQRVVFRQRSSQ